MVTVERLARSIVRDSLRPKEYEPVVISSYPHTIDLAEHVALECQKLGADPAIFLDTDAVFYGQFRNLTEENLRRVSAHCMGLAEYAQSYVWLGGPKDPGPMKRVPKERFAAMYAGEQAHYEKVLQKKPKSVGVALGMVTRERAKTYGFNYARWKAMTEAAIAVDYGQLEDLGRTFSGLLSTPYDVHVVADNGTDLRFRLAGPDRKVHVNDGVISDDDLAAGNPDAALPAGAVWVAPVEESAEGIFVSDLPIPQMGRLIQGLAWRFEHGRVTEFTAKRNVDLAQVGRDEATGEKDMFGSFGIGLNRKARPGFLSNFIVAGTVSVGVGDNREYGGRNRSTWGFAGTLSGATVEIAGKTVVADGKLAV
jgi:leucyl aminopeptidase (aminopeptidase T)